MNPFHRLLVCAVVTAITVLGAAQVRADDGQDQDGLPNRYVVTNLTSDLTSDILGVAPKTDPVLQNAWGVAFTPGASPFWIADNATGCSTLYDGQGAIASTLQVKLPLPGGSVPATACKPVDPNNPPNPTPAAPTGLVWNPTSTFLVPKTTQPATFIFDTDGHLLRRFASRGPLNSPWGVARASFAFGRFSGAILIGNFGNGNINAFDSDGDFLGTLEDLKGKPIVIDGLWTLTLGGGRNSRSDTLYFTAGPNGETDGLFGTITPASKN